MISGVVVIGMEETDEDPLCPMVVLRVRGTDFSRPIEAEAYAVKLLTITADVFPSRNLWMLTCLYGVLLGWKSKGIVAHRMEDIRATKSLVASEYIGGNIA